MATPDTFSATRPRYALHNRPWISGKLYDDLVRPSILHCDAFCIDHLGVLYLVIDWREGGKKRVALDAYLIEPDGLTPVWDTERPNGGRQVYWTRANHTIMARIHARVLEQASRLAVQVGWRRVMVQAHYVLARDIDPWPLNAPYQVTTRVRNENKSQD
jgi:hypothetical protein